MANRVSLADQIKEREQAGEKKERVAAITKILSCNDGRKDKQISAKVNEKQYALFSEINRAQGMTNNSALNLLINTYIRENIGIIRPEE